MKRASLTLAAAALAYALCAVSAFSQNVVASTTWTGAIARAAGAVDITVIAPMELQHPPEYEIKPSDLEAVSTADLVVYGGYEKFAKRLVETSGGSKVAEMKLFTDNVPAALKTEAKKIADRLGTTAAYERWAASFDPLAEGMRARVSAAYPKRRAAVHKMQKTFAEWLGFEVVGTFGPGEPSPAVVLDLVRKRPDVIIDNYHNPSGKPIAESLKAPRVELINFPGPGGTETLEDVYSYNERKFLDAAGKR